MVYVIKEEIEKQIIDDLSLEVPKKIINRFSTLVRESSSVDEKVAFEYLTSFLEEFNVPHQVHNPSIYLSVPQEATVRVKSPIFKEFRAKTPAFAVSTGDDWGSGEVVYIPSTKPRSEDDLFEGKIAEYADDLKGKVVISEGLPMPVKVSAFNDKGVAAAIFVSPGENIHDGICTSIWGSPDLTNMDDEPEIPVLAVNKTDGEELIKLCQEQTVTVDFNTKHKKGWFNCPVIDVFIEGTEEPEKYVLLHGHLDSWTVGIGDNATGDASLIEMARVFYKNRDKLKRSLRIAVWPGHSTGRYAGSTWFADNFALDLDENCVAQVNCDSPGCRWATSYDYMSWMSEVDDFCQDAIQDAVNQESKGKRPNRAGDYSFNNLGLTGFYMLSSSIPEEVLREKGYYPVGGCGGNIEWHTEDDLLHVADYDILMKDLKVYTTSVLRVLNNTIHPFNFVNNTEEFYHTLQSYQEAAGDHFDLSAGIIELDNLREALLAFYKIGESLKDKEVADEDVKAFNDKILQLSRILVRLNFATKGKFSHDPALPCLPLPDLASAQDLTSLEVNSHQYNVTLNHLRRGLNRLIWSFRQAEKVIGRTA